LNSDSSAGVDGATTHLGLCFSGHPKEERQAYPTRRSLAKAPTIKRYGILWNAGRESVLSDEKTQSSLWMIVSSDKILQ
jgi:hypothetical protein